MIQNSTLEYLANQKKKDAKALLSKGRHSAAVYIMGYSLEFALKRKIALTLGFTNGFPETNPEFNYYATQIAAFNAIGTGVTLMQVRQIRNHKLQDLLKFSGAETRIVTHYFPQWLIVMNWNPEERYKIRRFTHADVQSFIQSALTILNNI